MYKRQLEKARNAGRSGIETKAGCPLFAAETIEELAECLFEDATAQKAFVCAVARYNEMCSAGRDTDFGKRCV